MLSTMEALREAYRTGGLRTLLACTCSSPSGSWFGSEVRRDPRSLSDISEWVGSEQTDQEEPIPRICNNCVQVAMVTMRGAGCHGNDERDRVAVVTNEGVRVVMVTMRGSRLPW